MNWISDTHYLYWTGPNQPQLSCHNVGRAVEVWHKLIATAPITIKLFTHERPTPPNAGPESQS